VVLVDARAVRATTRFTFDETEIKLELDGTAYVSLYREQITEIVPASGGPAKDQTMVALETRARAHAVKEDGVSASSRARRRGPPSWARGVPPQSAFRQTSTQTWVSRTAASGALVGTPSIPTPTSTSFTFCSVHVVVGVMT
jgi:hypothetical protein